jgi:hypothetical protein
MAGRRQRPGPTAGPPPMMPLFAPGTSRRNAQNPTRMTNLGGFFISLTHCYTPSLVFLPFSLTFVIACLFFFGIILQDMRAHGERVMLGLNRKRLDARYIPPSHCPFRQRLPVVSRAECWVPRRAKICWIIWLLARPPFRSTCRLL